MVGSIRALAARAFWSVAVPLDPQQLTKMHGECRMAGRPLRCDDCGSHRGDDSGIDRGPTAAESPATAAPSTSDAEETPATTEAAPSTPVSADPAASPKSAGRVSRRAAHRPSRRSGETWHRGAQTAQFIGRFCRFGHNLPIDWTKSAGIRAGRGRRARSCPALQHVHLRDSLGKVGPPDPEVLPIHADAVDRLGLVTRVSAGAPHEDDSVA